MKIITEEMRFRKKLCEYALKNGVTKATRKYHTNRKFEHLKARIMLIKGLYKLKSITY